MHLHRIAAALAAAVLLCGCVSQATQQALTAARLACTAGNALACQQALVFQAQAEQERSESAAVGAGLLGAALIGVQAYGYSRW